MTRLLRSAEDALMRRLRKALSLERQFQLFGALDRLGCWPQPITAGPARGLKLVAPFSRRTSYCNGVHEPYVMAALAQIVCPGAIALDIGSHLGHFTVALARLVGPEGHVYSFEPLPEHVRLLQRTLALNRLENVTLIAQAVGAQQDEVFLEEWSHRALSRIVQERPPAPGRRGHRVPMTALNDWCDDRTLPRLDVIKIDTEGHELAVLSGASRAVQRYRPAFVCEIHFSEVEDDGPEAIVAWFRAAEYDLTPLPLSGSNAGHLEKTLDRCRERARRPGSSAVLHLLAVPRERGLGLR